MERDVWRPTVEIRSEIKGMTKMRRLKPDEFGALLYVANQAGMSVSRAALSLAVQRNRWRPVVADHLENFGLIESVYGESRWRVTVLGRAAADAYRLWMRQRTDGETADAETDGEAWEGLRRPA